MEFFHKINNFLYNKNVFEIRQQFKFGLYMWILGVLSTFITNRKTN